MRATAVFALVKAGCAFDLPTDEQVLAVCDRALETVRGRLKESADPNAMLVASTAAALARFELFSMHQSDTERFDYFKAGDFTLRRNAEKELAFERNLRDEALAAAAEILTDGGFFVATV